MPPTKPSHRVTRLTARKSNMNPNSPIPITLPSSSPKLDVLESSNNNNNNNTKVDVLEEEEEEKNPCHTIGENCQKTPISGTCQQTLISNVNESGPVVVGAVVSGNGKKKIVRKKTVRIVKKVIKKRVPKKKTLPNVQVEKADNISSSSSLDLGEVKKETSFGNVADKNNVIEMSNMDEKISGDGDETRQVSKKVCGETRQVESSKLVDNVVEKCNLVQGLSEKCVNDESDIVKQTTTSFVNEEVIGTSNVVVDEVLMRDVLIRGDDNDDDVPLVLEPIVSEKSNGVSDVGHVKTETFEVNSGRQCGLEPLNGDEGNNDQRDGYSVEMKSDNAIIGEVTKDLDVGSHFSMEEDEKRDYAAEITTQNQISKEGVDFAMESVSKETALASQNEEEEAGVGVVTDQNVGPVGEINVVSVEEKSGSDNGDLEKGSIIGLSEGLLLSGEMEALERKKRRKVEIFVGGLDKDAKEEDIRRVLEKAGTIVDLTLVMKGNTGKNKGFAFVKFATAADAKNALANPKIKICGKQCDISPVEGNDTIFLGNLDRKWKTEDVMQLLEKCGIDKIDEVILKADPKNTDKNRGFAFVELETNRVAQVAFNKLQKSTLVKDTRINVAWAKPLIEPNEEEILKIKSVYVEYVPSSWDEEKVKEYFKRFGEIESVALSKDITSSRRQDFAFINYMTREAALACIESVNSKRLENDGSKVKMTASLANTFSKFKPTKHASNPTIKQVPKEKPKSSYATIKLHEPKYSLKPTTSSYDHASFETRHSAALITDEPRYSLKPVTSSYGHAKFDMRPSTTSTIDEPRYSLNPATFSYDHTQCDTRPSDASTTNELVQLLRQQASNNHIPPRQSIGSSIPDNHFPPSGIKRPFSLVRHDILNLESRGLPRGRFESSYPISGPSDLSHAGFVRTEPLPYHHHYEQQQPPPPRLGLPSESVNGRNIYPSHLQSREQPPYYGNNNTLYRRY